MQAHEQNLLKKRIQLVQCGITDEFFRAVEARYNGWLRRHLSKLVQKPARRLAELLAKADVSAEIDGLPGASRSLMGDLNLELNVRRQTDSLADGPIIYICNHPGAFDSICIGVSNERKDLKVIASDVPLYHHLPEIFKRIIPVSADLSNRFSVVRKAIRHLSRGGALLQFGAGKIEPDPQAEAGTLASLREWSPSLEPMLRKVPHVQIYPLVVSGVVSPRYLHSPLTVFRTLPKDKRRIAEFLEVSTMLLNRRKQSMSTHLSFGKPFGLDDLEKDAQGRNLHEVFLRRMAGEIRCHLEWLKSLGVNCYD